MTDWLPVNAEAFPREFYEMPSAVWRAEPRKGEAGRWNKAPRSIETLKKIGVDNPSAFGRMEDAIRVYRSGLVTGVGVLLIGDGLVGIDVDYLEDMLAGEYGAQLAAWLSKARDEECGLIPPYIEQSPSGKGLRIFLRGCLSATAQHKKGGLEIYSRSRFLTVTGERHPEFSPTRFAIGVRQDLIDSFEQLIANYAQNKPRTSENPLEGLIEGICKKMQQKHPNLWAGEWERIGKYPSQSEADFAALGYILKEAKNVGLDKDQLPVVVESCFIRSGLYRAEKYRTLQRYSIPKLLNDVRPMSAPSRSVREAFSGLILRDEDVQRMKDADFLIPNMIVRGHLAAYIAPGNGGKTTIFTYLAGLLASKGLEVFYINVDGSPGDLKRQQQHAVSYGYSVIAPDARAGGSIDAVIKLLRDFASSDADLSNTVFILDTLKKFVNVIEKREARGYYQLMRSLTVRGSTICLLGHSNKYRDKDNQQIFEGTADLRNDVDELIYFDIFMNEKDRTLEITTRPDKVRAEFFPKSYVIHLDESRRVTEPEAVITVMEKAERGLLEQLVQALSRGHRSQKDIISDVRQTTAHSDKKIREVLIKHAKLGEVISCRPAGRAKDLEYFLVDQERSFPF